MVLGKDSRKKWNRWDFLLAKAFQRYEDEKCPQCGQPIYLCHNSDNQIEFRAVKDECLAMAEVERANDSKGDKKKEHGVRYVPELKLRPADEGADLDPSDFRVPYYRELATRKGLIPEVDSEEFPETE